MAISFVAVGPIAYVASGASSLTVERPAGTAEGDVMLAVVFSRRGTFAAASTDPAGSSVGDFEVIADDGTRWTTRYHAQHLLYRPVGASEPADYTFAFTTAGGGLGAVEDDYLVGVIVAYRGAEVADPVGAYDSTGDPIVLGGSEQDPGRQFEANIFASGGSSGPAHDNPWTAAYWYTTVADMLATFVVLVDWQSDVDPEGEPFVWPAPPEEVTVDWPAGWTERTPEGSWLKIADGPPGTEPLEGSTDLGSGTWRGRAVTGWDIGRYDLSSPAVDTADTFIDTHTFTMVAYSWYLPVYAGAEEPPPTASGWFVGSPMAGA